MADFATITPVPVTAYSTVSACGMGNNALYQDLLANRTALGDLTFIDVAFQTHVGEVSEKLPEIRPELEIYNSRNSRLALAALNFAGDGLRGAVELAKSRYGKQRIGIVVGTSTSGLFETESFRPGRI